ncbi:SGNH/GDSL hydrolase family protein [Gloeothece verrucosa]|uniref:SGNH hydrolase-type esterase domain-containing protein n=1 Tax=Gloeothece verrucosa (strain PCC 7822) TaxID=497965 RepID=E0UE35_GLOV7|nr:SGNH/GDSL hydrolase family protein [Gloeothece verrucosa]ADN13039.1 conserved hypothetical protein [Gloeothece verrucosa PCC 7822]
MKILIFILAILLGLLVIIEVSLRLFLGLGNPALYIPDEQIGYLLAPNQRVRRMGNQIVINQYSMRTHPIEAKRPAATVRLFLVGDSLANGAWWTDQQQTISSLIQKQLKLSGYNQVEVLNASANSWGPRNELAYLKRFGTFESQVVILLLNTDDLFASAPTSMPVGRDRNYPDHKPLLALNEIISQFIPSSPMPAMVKENEEKGDPVGINLAAIKEIHNLTLNKNAKLLLAITPLKREINAATQRDYERKARERLSDWAAEEGIAFVDFLPLFRAEKTELLYRDTIHLTEKGNQLVSHTLTQSLRDLF